jgi:hypothetical protein
MSLNYKPSSQPLIDDLLAAKATFETLTGTPFDPPKADAKPKKAAAPPQKKVSIESYFTEFFVKSFCKSRFPHKFVDLSFVVLYEEYADGSVREVDAFAGSEEGLSSSRISYTETETGKHKHAARKAAPRNLDPEP